VKRLRRKENRKRKWNPNVKKRKKRKERKGEDNIKVLPNENERKTMLNQRKDMKKHET